MKRVNKEEKWLLYAIPILFILGALFHFLFDLSGQNPVVGSISAVNESVWEHNKMVIMPTILFYVFFYFWKGKEYSIDKDKWFTAALVSVVTMLIFIPMAFYFYTEAFGVELIWVDILLLLLANIVGQLIGLHVYRYGKGIKWYIPVAALIIIVLVYAYFTFNPPHLPIFKDDTK